MVAGLKENDNRSGFMVDMGTFGTSRDGVCFGCAATCTLQKLSGVKFTNSNIGIGESRRFAIQYSGIGTDVPAEKFTEFEAAIDLLRSTNYEVLIEFFGVREQFDEANRKDPEVYEATVDLQNLGTTDWNRKLEPYEKFAAKLEEHGL